MKTTTRIYYRTLILALVIAAMVVSLTTGSALAQTREIPVYVQIHLNKVIAEETASGDTIRFEKMNLKSILSLLDHSNHRLASAAAYALGEIRDAEAVPALVAALKSDRDHMRRIAAHALGKIGDSRAVMPLIEVLCDETQPVAVQASAVVSLSKIGDPRAKRILTHLNQSPRSWLQQTATVALQKIEATHDYTLAAVK